jgi:hypothetical protein
MSGSTTVSNDRIWLARQLLDDRLDDKAVWGIVAYYPPVKDIHVARNRRTEQSYWMIERNRGQDKAIQCWNALSGWTTDHKNGVRFDTREHAENYRSYMHLEPLSVVTEHMLVGTAKNA